VADEFYLKKNKKNEIRKTEKKRTSTDNNEKIKNNLRK
jgi:hypothetical protein